MKQSRKFLIVHKLDPDDSQADNFCELVFRELAGGEPGGHILRRAHAIGIDRLVFDDGSVCRIAPKGGRPENNLKVTCSNHSVYIDDNDR